MDYTAIRELPQRTASRLYHNLGHGKFEDVTEKSGFGAAPGKGMGISIADFNDDGWPDVFIANDTEPNSLFINQRNGTFEEKGLELGVAYNDNAQVGSRWAPTPRISTTTERWTSSTTT